MVERDDQDQERRAPNYWVMIATCNLQHSARPTVASQIDKESDAMVKTFSPGSLVVHAVWGLGKVLEAQESLIRVYFKGADEASPDDRVKAFRLPTEHLHAAECGSDDVLDNLPPYRDGGFVRAKTDLHLQRAIKKFMGLFKQGLEDPDFIQHELAYKRSAHQRYLTRLRPEMQRWIDEQNSDALVAAVEAVYGDPRAPKLGNDTRLNLMFMRVDEPAFFDALRGGGELSIRFVRDAVAFTEAPSLDSFDRYLEALRALPIRKGGQAIDKWTTITWFPFIADPSQHIVIKPTIMQEFASIIPFDIRYRSEPNFETYRACVSMARVLGSLIERSALNISARKLDLIDVQSFMWVVERWHAAKP